VVEISVPPLRERRGDIPLLATHLLVRASRAMHRSRPVLSDAAAAALQRHSWPGNVRELENCLTRALVVAGGDVIHPSHLFLTDPGVPIQGRPQTLDEVDRAHIEHVMAATGGKKAEASRLLGVSRPRLDRLLKRFGLD
jgi:DNA-binding NtrC family response regulator